MSEIRKYAVLDDNTVVEVLDLDEAGCIHETSYHQMLVDVNDLVIVPEVGWILNGNQLAPPASGVVMLRTIINSRIKHYQDQAPALLRDLYTENTLLGLTTVQSDQMFTDYSDVLIRIREGAWPTAIYRLTQKSPSGFVTQEMLDSWSSIIASRILT